MFITTSITDRPLPMPKQINPSPQLSFLKILFSIILPPTLTCYTFLPVSLPKPCVQFFPQKYHTLRPSVKTNTKNKLTIWNLNTISKHLPVQCFPIHEIWFLSLKASFLHLLVVIRIVCGLREIRNIGEENTDVLRKTCPSAALPSQIPHGLARERLRVCATTGQRLTTNYNKNKPIYTQTFGCYVTESI
jgi:hypothetical protein